MSSPMPSPLPSRLPASDATAGTVPGGRRAPLPMPAWTDPGLSGRWGLVLLRAVAAILFGLLALLLPGPTMASLVLLFAAYMLVDGVFALMCGVRAARGRLPTVPDVAADTDRPWGWFVLEGVANIAAAALAVFWPGLTVLAFVWLAGVWAIVSGAFMAVAALRVRRHRGRWLLAAGGAASLIWGGLLVARPVTGALVMTLWLGAYAVVFGIALLFLALQLWRQQRSMPPLDWAQPA